MPVNAHIGPETYNGIETNSQLEKGVIARMEWAKREERRAPNQKTAHVVVSFITREAANQVIQNGMTVGGKWVNGYRDQRDPQRCMKCQSFGHIARECKSEKDICGRCKENHRTSDCTATNEDFYCANCKRQGHIASDRNCPALMRKIKERAQRNPEHGYWFFVTDHPDTWTRDEDNNEGYDKDWRLKVQKNYDDRMGFVKGGNGKGRLTGGARGDGSGSVDIQQPSQPQIQTQTQHIPQHDTNLRPRTIDSYGWEPRNKDHKESHHQGPPRGHTDAWDYQEEGQYQESLQ